MYAQFVDWIVRMSSDFCAITLLYHPEFAVALRRCKLLLLIFCLPSGGVGRRLLLSIGRCAMAGPATSNTRPEHYAPAVNALKAGIITVVIYILLPQLMFWTLSSFNPHYWYYYVDKTLKNQCARLVANVFF